MCTRGPFPEEMRVRFGLSDNGGRVEAETQQNGGQCLAPSGLPEVVKSFLSELCDLAKLIPTGTHE